MLQNQKSGKAPDPQTIEQKFRQMIDEFNLSMNRAFHTKDEIDRFCSIRGIPQAVLEEVMSGNPMALCIPLEYGGLGGNVKENIAFLSAVSYESLSLSLTLGINNGLFIQPVAKYGQDSVKAKVFSRFMNNSSMGGLMITEPDFGSDALSMQTSFTEKDGIFHLSGKKHWAGLTGMAELWLLTARKKADSGGLMRDIDMFICDSAAPGQKIVVEEYFENLGLYQIPYGRNQIDVYIPEEQRLVPHTSGIQMLLDLLHRSRFQFPGMGLGFLRRMLDEAISHTKSRLVGNRKLFEYDQVQNRLVQLQSNFTICSAFCLKSGELAGMENNLSQLGLEANIIKSVTSDMMQESAQSLLQLVGAKGYKLNHIAGRSVVDSRPFQIFEGSNDILYHQIAEAFLKLMKTAKEKNLLQFLMGFSARASDRLQKLINFEPDFQLTQRKLVQFGQVVSRIFSMDMVLYLEEKGFRKDLIDNTLITLKLQISELLNTFEFENNTSVVHEYSENSTWYDFTDQRR
jgi:alkylation response protein AidB-like acyl-CoA dehydrogenase